MKLHYFQQHIRRNASPWLLSRERESLYLFRSNGYNKLSRALSLWKNTIFPYNNPCVRFQFSFVARCNKSTRVNNNTSKTQRVNKIFTLVLATLFFLLLSSQSNYTYIKYLQIYIYTCKDTSVPYRQISSFAVRYVHNNCK